MDKRDSRYGQFALIEEMLSTPSTIRAIDQERIASWPLSTDRLFLTGEGSSRIFPAKRVIAEALREGYKQTIATESSEQAREYRLDDYAVFAASNSGRTAEVVRLLDDLQAKGHSATTAIVAYRDTPATRAAAKTYLLNCGAEQAVAATKSVMEQALFYDILLRSRNGKASINLEKLADSIEHTLTMPISSEILEATCSASTLYFSGRNDGVAEELTLKTNEITRRKSEYLEGTYALHGIEETMRPDEAIILIEPFESVVDKYDRLLRQAIGIPVVAIASAPTPFPTIVIPDLNEGREYIRMAAGWNLLVEIGLRAGVDLDRPVRTRKIGNDIDG